MAFLFVFHCNYGRILYRFRDKARYCSKKSQFFIHSFNLTCTITSNSLEFFPQNFRTNCPSLYKLLDSAIILPKSSTLCVRRNNATDDRQTGRQTADKRTAHAIRRTSHTRTVVRECCKGDDASQWRSPKFDPPPHHVQTLYAGIIKIGRGDYVVDPYTCAKVRHDSPRCFLSAHA